MVDRDLIESEAQAQIRTVVTAQRHVASAAEVDEAAIGSVNTPAIFTMMIEEESEGRMAVGRKAQIELLRLRVGIVVENYRSTAAAITGLTGLRTMAQQVKKALVGFKGTGCLRSWTFRKTEYVGRASARLTAELEFDCTVHETYE